MASAVVSILIFLMALGEAGFVPARTDWSALAVALVLYAIPFWVLLRAQAKPTPRA